MRDLQDLFALGIDIEGLADQGRCGELPATWENRESARGEESPMSFPAEALRRGDEVIGEGSWLLVSLRSQRLCGI